jgi:membrane protease YdiL (CAAX protease family)
VTSAHRPRVWPVFVGFAVVFIAVQVASALLLGAWAYLMSAPGSGVDGFAASLDSLMASPAGLTLAVLVSATGLAVGALLAASLSPEPWRRRLRVSVTGLSAGTVALVVVGVLAVSQALDATVALLGLQRYGALDYINRVLGRASGGWLVALCFVLSLGPGLAEELFFRGFMQTRLAQRFGAALAIAVTAASFGFIHFDLVHTPVAAILGVFLGWSAERTGTIVPAMAAHAVNNLVAVLTARVTWLSSRPAQVIALAAGLAVAAAVILMVPRRAPVAEEPPPA